MRILKINSLPNSKTWIDRDFVMLHSCFQILKDYIEKEEGDTQCSYESHKDFVDEVRLLYNWWLKRGEEVFHDDDNIVDRDNEMLLRLIKIRTQLWT